MPFFGLDLITVGIAAVAGYAFGAVYYMTLSKPWLAAIGKSKDDLSGGAGTFITAFVAQIVMAAVFAYILDNFGPGGVKPALATGALLWLGFVLTTIAVNHGFQGSKRSLTVIDSLHWLGVLLIQGLVIGLARSGAIF